MLKKFGWVVGSVLGVTALGCAHGIDPSDIVIGNDASSGASGHGSVGPTETGGSAGTGANVATGSGGSGGNGGDSIVDISRGSAGIGVDDGSTGVPDAAVADADAASPIVEVGPPCPSGGKALSFEGSSRVDIPGTSVPIGNSARTVEMWVSPASMTAPAWSPDHTIFEHGSGDLKAFALDMDATPKMELYVNPAANSFFFDTGIAQAKWFHVATTYDGATTVHAYVNGADKGTKTLTGPLASVLSTLTVGGTNGSRYFMGAIDEVRVWNFARSASQIQQNMSVRLNGNETGLVGYWHFDEGSGTTANDSSTKGVAGTVVGPAAWVASGVTLSCK